MGNSQSNIDTNAIAAVIGETYVSIEALESGANSDVWRLTTNRGVYVLRCLHERPASNSIAVDIGIRNFVLSAGGNVADPVTSSLDFPEVMGGTDWLLDKYVEGKHPLRGCVETEVCHGIGQTLKLLHNLPVLGFGVPSLNAANTYVGSENSPISGLNTRFDNPLPKEENILSGPISMAAPELIGSIIPNLIKIRSLMSKTKGVICHSDLHELQFIIQNHSLAALIDFGDSTINDYRWDFGSLLYFHGPRVLKDVVEGYTEGASSRQELFGDAHLFSIGIAMHQASRSQLPGKSHRLQVAVDHLEQTLEYLDTIRF